MCTIALALPNVEGHGWSGLRGAAPGARGHGEVDCGRGRRRVSLHRVVVGMHTSELSLPHERADRGLTLVELLVVVAIIAVLAGGLIVRMSAARATAEEDAARATASSLAAAVSSFYLANACYPRDVGAGSVPGGMGPYVGGQWPSEYDYEQWDWWPNGIGISWRPGGTYRWTLWVTQSVAVSICP